LLGGCSKPSPASKTKPANRDSARGGQPRGKQDSPQEVEVNSARLYVGNLDYNTTGSDLEQYFSKVGSVKSAEIVMNRHTQKSKGFAFVEMGGVDEARKAVDSCHNEEFMGRRILVSGAKSPGANDGNGASEGERSGRQNQRSGSDRNRRPRDGRRDDRHSEAREEPRRAKKVEEPVNITSSRLRLDNLDFEVGEAELEDLFRGIGVVVSTEVAADPDTHQSKGYGFVEMSHIDEAQRAVDILNNKDFMGRRLSINGAKEGESAQTDSSPEEDQSETVPAVEV
jgi:RNA recognition motif-containing protein